MKRTFYFMLLACLVIFFACTIETLAATRNSTSQSQTDKKLLDLSKRVSSFEANWGRFQLGGLFSFVPYVFLNDQSKNPVIEYNQEIELFLDAFIDQNMQFSLKLTNQRGWGAGNQYIGANIQNPLQIDEAFLKMQYPNSFNYLGKFRFSLGTFGIISDFYSNPVEGVAIQHGFGKYHLVAIYDRVNTLYDPNTNQALSGEDYLAGRIGWSNKSDVFGLNLLPNGIGGEKSFSIDWSRSTSKYKVSAEASWYSFQSVEYPDLNTSMAPGLLFSYGYRVNRSNYLQFKAGYFAPDFRPSLTSLAYCSGDDREWFLSNSKGIELYWMIQPAYVYQMENRLILLTAADGSQANIDYHLRSVISRNISPVNQVNLGVDLKNFNNVPLTQIFASWALRF